MLWSPNEVLAYLKEDVNLQNNDVDKRENKMISKTAAFGGFPTWLLPEQDFVFIAENSEIYGPNALFTIPCQSKEVDLNVLATRILSADYQGISSKKIISLKHAQLLMPDVSKDMHIAVNHFVLFDTEARGFIRPTCIAYITSDKYKLICFADSILNVLSEASAIFQHCNMLHTINDLKALLQDISLQTVENNVNEQTIQDKVAEDITKDIKDIIGVIESYEGNVLIDKQLSAISENLKKSSVFSEFNKLFNSSSSSDIHMPLQRKNKNYHNYQKRMKSLYSICGNGTALGLYHLYTMHKHFRRKSEDLYLTKCLEHCKTTEEKLYFGACVKSSDMSMSSFTVKDCILNTKRTLKVPSLDNQQYFNSLDVAFEKVLVDFLNWEKNSFYESEQTSSFHLSSDCSDISTGPESLYSSSSGYLSFESEETNCLNSQCGHIVPLESVWDILEDIQRENSGIESTFLEILKLFDDTQRLLFSVLTRIPIIIISTPEECLTAQDFIKALSVFLPRRKDEILLIELNRKEPLVAENFECIAAVNICVHYNKSVEEMIPQHLLHSLCILNLKDCSLTAPAYTGVLLSNVNERFRMLPLEGPAFPIFVGILCDVQSVVEWWLMVTSPSVDNSAATSSSLSKGFSRMDVQILLTLSKLCRR